MNATAQPPVEIRVARETDASMLARLRYELRSSLRIVVENDAMFLERCAAWMHERLREESNWKCWIAEWQGTAVGNVWAQLIEKIPNPIAEPEHFVYLTNFYVAEEHRSKGIGSLLLPAVLDWSRSMNAQVVILWPTERSKPFYARHGFSVAGDAMTLTIKGRA
ncbi:MAG TPA: GNAT family N-acetyltransferase [Pyrinomonadaceae bacterium]|nr:GNAT family N-acetyltransferase [Pyrinomonadaceae bacterium]